MKKWFRLLAASLLLATAASAGQPAAAAALSTDVGPALLLAVEAGEWPWLTVDLPAATTRPSAASAAPVTPPGFVICDIRTCRCFACQPGGPCEPVSPPDWCTPI